MMRLQWFAVALMIFGALATGQTAGALEFTLPISTPFPGSAHIWPTDPNGDGTLNSWSITDGDAGRTFALWEDDNPITGGVQTHFICDLGRMTDITQVKMVSRESDHFYNNNPNSVDFYYFADGTPYDSDDIEGDANIMLGGHFDFPGIRAGASAVTDWVDSFSARYVGVRVNSSHTSNAQIGDLYFETPDTTPMRSPLIAYHSSGTDPNNCVDGDFNTYAVFSDDDVGTVGVQGHIIFDLGEATEVGGMKLKTLKGGSWNDYVNPKDVDFYYFDDDVASDSDDIEGDANIVLIDSHAFTGLRRVDGWPEFTYFDDAVEKRYIGMRVNSSHDSAGLDFEVSEIELFAGGGFVPPPPIPGDANLDNIVNDQDASILAAHWQAGPGAAWGDGDFNDDGFVNDQDASILAAHWQESQEGAAPVPEPTTVVMLLGGLLSLWIWRRR